MEDTKVKITKKLELPGDFKLSDLADNYNNAASAYADVMRKARMLQVTASGDLWKAVAAKYPVFQILPDSNFVSYIRDNILASIYTVGKSANIQMTSQEDKDIVTNINIIMDKIWEECSVAKYQLLAGSNAALLNYGVTYVGWDNKWNKGKGDGLKKGRGALQNISPLRFMRDANAIDLDHASYCLMWDDYHKTVIKNDKRYKEQFTAYERTNSSGALPGSIVAEAATDKVSASTQNNYRIFVHYVKDDDGKIHEIHTVNNEWVLYVKEDITPSKFPFVELYCNVPDDNLHGMSECAKMFRNNIAYNVLSSNALTSEYKNQHPPKFINAQSGINAASFVKYGNDADKTFIVNGDASKAVHYHAYPVVSDVTPRMLATLLVDIQTTTGVDGRYTGRDTGSILTTGGVNAMLDQVSLIDTTKILNYERYCKELTELIIMNYIQHSSYKRRYFVQDKQNPKKWSYATVDFPEIDNDTFFDYTMVVSSEYPKSKARAEAVADNIMQMQMQYKGAGIDVDLITPQEWLMQKDLPNKEFMLERMEVQRVQNFKDLVSNAIKTFSVLNELGMSPDDAINKSAEMMANSSSATGSSVEDQLGELMGGETQGVEQGMAQMPQMM